MSRKNNLFGVLFFLASFIIFSACEEDEDNNGNEDENAQLENNLVGTWKYDNPSDYYWYQFKFNADSTGKRTDADGQVDSFTYTFTETEIDCSDGIWLTMEYSIIKDTNLVIFNDTLVKQ